MNFKTAVFSYPIVCSKFAKLSEFLVESILILRHAVLCERLYQRGGWHFKIALPLSFTNVLDKVFFSSCWKALPLEMATAVITVIVHFFYVMLCSILLAAWEWNILHYSASLTFSMTGKHTVRHNMWIPNDDKIFSVHSCNFLFMSSSYLIFKASSEDHSVMSSRL